MDNVKIDIIGYGVEVALASLNEIQTNYILAHNIECNTVIPIISQNNQLTYNDWRLINNEGSFVGATLNSEVTIKVNDIPYTFSSINKIDNNFINDSNKNYLMSMEHTNNFILSTEFNTESFDISKLSLLIKNLDNIFWGELIYGIEYDNEILTTVITNGTYYEFENIIVKNNLIIPIQKY